MAKSKLEESILQLQDEHDKVLEVADDVERAATALQEREPETALSALRNGLSFLQRHVRVQTALEESLLFPALRRHVPPWTIEALTEEHADIRWAMDLLEQGLDEEREVRVVELRWHATALVDLLRRHTEKESNVLLLLPARPCSTQESESLATAVRGYLKASRQVT